MTAPDHGGLPLPDYDPLPLPALGHRIRSLRPDEISARLAPLAQQPARHHPPGKAADPGAGPRLRTPGRRRRRPLPAVPAFPAGVVQTR